MLKNSKFLFRAVSSVLFLGNISRACGESGHQGCRNTGQLRPCLPSCSDKTNCFVNTNIKTFVFIPLRSIICLVFFKLENCSLEIFKTRLDKVLCSLL